MTVIKPPAIVVLLRRGAGRGVLFNTLMVTTGLWELTVSVSARTLITVTLLSFSFCFSLKQTLLPPPRATSIAIVTKANPTQQCCRGSVAQKCVYDWTLKAKGAERRRVVLSVPLCWLARQTCHWPKTATFVQRSASNKDCGHNLKGLHSQYLLFRSFQACARICSQCSAPVS